MSISDADFKDSTENTEIVFGASRHGYEYGFEVSRLGFFGAVILLRTVALCVVYVVWIFGMGKTAFLVRIRREK